MTEHHGTIYVDRHESDMQEIKATLLEHYAEIKIIRMSVKRLCQTIEVMMLVLGVTSLVAVAAFVMVMFA